MITINEAQELLQNLTKVKITQIDIADALGCGRSNISLRAKKNSKLSFNEIKKLEQYFNLNLTEDKQTINIEECLSLPVLGEVSASMGTGIEVYNESATGYYKISKKVLSDIGANPNTSDIIFAEGDSMEPTIQGGSALIVDKSRTELKDGKIYCIQFNGALMAKRLQLLPPKKLRVISDNYNKYPSFDVELGKELDFEFKIVGEVMRWMTNAR